SGSNHHSITGFRAIYTRGGSFTLRSCCCARQRCSFVSGACGCGTTITTGVCVGAAGVVGTICPVASAAADSVGAVLSAVAPSSGDACSDGATLGTPIAVKLGDAVSDGKRVARTCVCEGVLICSGCPQPASISTIGSIHQRRTTARRYIRTSVLVPYILPRANCIVKRRFAARDTHVLRQQRYVTDSTLHRI